MRFFSRPALAVVFGAFIACAEACLHFEDIIGASSWADLPIHDWLAAGLLVWGGSLSSRNWQDGRPYLIAGWAFMSSLLIGAFLAHWEELSVPAAPDEWIPPGVFVAIIGGLMTLAIGGLAGSIARR